MTNQTIFLNDLISTTTYIWVEPISFKDFDLQKERLWNQFFSFASKEKITELEKKYNHRSAASEISYYLTRCIEKSNDSDQQKIVKHVDLLCYISSVFDYGFSWFDFASVKSFLNKDSINFAIEYAVKKFKSEKKIFNIYQLREFIVEWFFGDYIFDLEDSNLFEFITPENVAILNEIKKMDLYTNKYAKLGRRMRKKFENCTEFPEPSWEEVIDDGYDYD